MLEDGLDDLARRRKKRPGRLRPRLLSYESPTSAADAGGFGSRRHRRRRALDPHKQVDPLVVGAACLHEATAGRSSRDPACDHPARSHRRQLELAELTFSLPKCTLGNVRKRPPLSARRAARSLAADALRWLFIRARARTRTSR